METGNNEQLAQTIIIKKTTSIKIDIIFQFLFIAVNIAITVIGILGLIAFALVPVYVLLIVNFSKCKASLAELGVKNAKYTVLGIIVPIVYVCTFLLTVFISWH